MSLVGWTLFDDRLNDRPREAFDEPQNLAPHGRPSPVPPEIFEERFSAARMAGDYIKIYERIAAGNLVGASSGAGGGATRSIPNRAQKR